MNKKDTEAYLGDGIHMRYKDHEMKLWCQRDEGDHYIYFSYIEICALLEQLAECGFQQELAAAARVSKGQR